MTPCTRAPSGEPVGGGGHGVVGVLVRGGGRQDHDLVGAGGGQEPAVEVAPAVHAPPPTRATGPVTGADVTVAGVHRRDWLPFGSLQRWRWRSSASSDRGSWAWASPRWPPAGMTVVLRSRKQETADALVAGLGRSLAKQVERGKLDEAEAAAVAGRAATADLGPCPTATSSWSRLSRTSRPRSSSSVSSTGL